ncbi:hypothetical protein Tco_1447087 [Tanacetum coccineum]
MVEKVPKTLEYKSGQLNADPMLEAAGVQKPKAQWTSDERKAANLDQRLKSLIMFLLTDDHIYYVINCETTKSTWDDLILYHEGPSDVKESRVMDLKNTNHVTESELASLFGKLNYEENLIDSIYEIKKKKPLTTTTPLSTAFISTSIVQDFQDSPNDEDDTKNNQEYMNDLEMEFHKRGILAKSKRLNKDFEAKYNKGKAKLALLDFGASTSKSSQVRNQGLVAESYEWDEEEVSSDDNAMVEVKVPMALDDDETKHVNTEILQENQNLRKELKDKIEITETWLNSSNKVNQCSSEQILNQKKRILGIDQLTKDPSSSAWKDLVFIKSLANDSKVSIPNVERPLLSKAEGFNFPNHDTSKILPSESNVNVTNSSVTDYDSTKESSSVCCTPLPSLEKLVGVEPVSGLETIKLILKSNPTFKDETLKGVTINEPTLAPAKGNKNVSASKKNSAPAGKLKNVKIKDDIPLSIVMKELNYLKLQISKNQSSYVIIKYS